MGKTRNSATSTRGRQSPASRERLKAGSAALKLAAKHDFQRSLERHERKRKAKPARIVAYDFETTRIKADDTPVPVYLTAFEPGWTLEVALRDMAHLTRILIDHFLTVDRIGTKFVAWNGNRFDAFIVAAALLHCDQYILKPYMTRSKTLRGLRVVQRCDDEGSELDERSAPSWEFLDGIAMLGLAGVTLDKFLSNFAPEFPKMKGAVDFEKENFDPENPEHRAYALRDSEGLWHGMNRAQQIMLDTFNEPLRVTMGGTCIRIFQAHIPRGVSVVSLIPDAEEIVREYVVRGGYCWCARRYQGPVWKYDLNQAYAAAMRDAKLPCGDALRLDYFDQRLTGQPYIVRIKATRRGNPIPFYYRTRQGNRLTTVFSGDTIEETWITSIEHQQLVAEGWSVTAFEMFAWPSSFDMREYVDKLETLRMNAAGGPSGSIGTMVKATGNHSYGKTLESIDAVEYILAADCPDDCVEFFGDGADPLAHVFYRFDPDRGKKPYHQPHIGAFITAHVRMQVRRAALIDPAAWLYADTDCVMFTRDVAVNLDIHPSRYGAWKVEEEGAPYRVIGKKIYASLDGRKRSAKGLNVRRLTADDFARWIEGESPVQDQVQLQNFFAVMVGAPMFRSQRRQGTKIQALEASRKLAPHSHPRP